MITYYQRRGTGKSSGLVLQSHASGLPIAAYSQSHADHLQWLADEVLHITTLCLHIHSIIKMGNSKMKNLQDGRATTILSGVTLISS